METLSTLSAGSLRNRLAQIRQRIARGLATDTAELMQVCQAFEVVS